MFNNVLTMKWEATTMDSVLTGWLRNSVVVGIRDKDSTNNLNIRAVSLFGGHTAAADQDIQAIINMVITP